MKKKVKAERAKVVNSNPNNIWFRAKYYGWGWYPATWQGWITMLIWAGLFIIIVGSGDDKSNMMFSVVLPAILITIALIIVCYIKGDKPCWRWGGCKN